MKKNGFSPILIVLILVILGAVGYFGYKRLEIQTSSFQTKVDTVNWKIFNSKYGYSVKYPSDWDTNISLPGGKGNADPQNSYFPIFEFQCGVDNYKAGKLCTQIKISSIPYNSLGIGDSEKPSINVKDKFSPDFSIDLKREKVINRIGTKLDMENAVGFEYFVPGYASLWQYVVVSDHDDTRYTITYQELQTDRFSNPITPAEWQNKQIFDTILSTFTFTK